MKPSWLAEVCWMLFGLIPWVISGPASAGRIVFYESPEMQLQAADPVGIVEPPVAISFNDQLIHGHDHLVTELYRRVPGTGSKPLVLADLVSSTFVRPTYLKSDGTSGTLATSLLSAPSFRTPAGLKYVPQVDSAQIEVPSMDVYRSTVQYHHADQLNGTTVLESGSIVPNASQFQVHTSWMVGTDIDLAGDSIFRSSDRFRMLTVSSMFANGSRYDTDLIRIAKPDGDIAEVRLGGLATRDRHLFDQAIEVGNWFELVNEPGSTWSPDNATVRIELPPDRHLRLGIQGYLSGSLLSNSDSLTVWLEWLDAPDRITPGTQFDMSYTLIARAPRGVPEPSSAWLALASLLAVGRWVRRRP